MQKRNEILKEATKMFAAEKDVTEQEAASMVNGCVKISQKAVTKEKNPCQIFGIICYWFVPY